MPKQIVGYTPGTFDLFHIGHLNVLQRARAQCDYLIVAVSTDELVTQCKRKRPVIPFEERIAIVRALRCVDMAVPQLNMNKLEAYLEHRFDKLFVGSDLQGTPRWLKYEEEITPYGVQFVYLPHTDGVSSTLLKERIKSSGLLPE